MMRRSARALRGLRVALVLTAALAAASPPVTAALRLALRSPQLTSSRTAGEMARGRPGKKAIRSHCALDRPEPGGDSKVRLCSRSTP